MSHLWIWISEQLFKVDTFRKECIIFATYEYGSEMVSVPENPEECLWQRKISQLEQLYGTLSAKDSLLLHWGDDALHFTASSDVGWDGSWILIRKEINCFSRLYTNSRTTVVCHFHLSSAFMGLDMTECSFHLCTVSRYNALFHSKRTHHSISGKCIWKCSNIWFISCHRLL